MTTHAAASRQGPVRDVLDQVARETGAVLVDPWTTLCPDGLCTIEGPGLIRYRDRQHISVPQSVALAPQWERALRAASDGLYSRVPSGQGRCRPGHSSGTMIPVRVGSRCHRSQSLMCTSSKKLVMV